MVYETPVSRGGIKDRAPVVLATALVRGKEYRRGAGRMALVSWYGLSVSRHHDRDA
jgi:hypothetical protein